MRTLFLALILPTASLAQSSSSIVLRLANGETYEFPSTALFQESEDGGTKAICVVPLSGGPGLTLAATFDLESTPVEVEQEALIVILGTLDPLLGLYADDGPNRLSLSSFANGVLSGSYVGTLTGIVSGGTVSDAWVRSSFVASQATDESCPVPSNR